MTFDRQPLRWQSKRHDIFYYRYLFFRRFSRIPFYGWRRRVPVASTDANGHIDRSSVSRQLGGYVDS
jgi:hypothetical protein